MIAVPDEVTLQEAREFLQTVEWEIERDATATIDFAAGSGRIEPWVFAAIAAYALKAHRWDMTLSVSGVEECDAAMRMGIVRFTELGRIADSDGEPTGSRIPLRWVLSSRDLALVFADVVPLLHLADAPEQAKAIQYCVSEMVRNVMEHSRSDDGAIVAAELYPAGEGARARVSIAVADAGIGIRPSIGRNYEVPTDAEAILTAVKPGTTGAERGRYGATENAGAGLFFTRRMARTTGGHFAVLSGEALFLTSPNCEADNDASLVSTIAAYPGTVIAIEVGTDVRFDLSDFLADTAEAFYARSDRASRRSRRARFI